MKDKWNSVITEVDREGSLGHKDLYLTAGVETTAGSLVLKGYRPQYSATVVAKLEAAGRRTKYKLNCDAWAHGSSGENSAFGPTRNPWDPQRTAGGSSSGSAAAVAAGLVEVATGTDTGGSIRLPASFTNTTAIKPTYGAISRYGIVAMASSFDSPGIFSTSVSQVREEYRRASGVDEHDPTTQSPARGQPTERSNKPTRVLGIPAEYFEKGLDDEVRAKVLEAVRVFEEAGYRSQPVALPHTKYGIAAYYLVQTTEVASNLARYDGIRYGHDRSQFGAEAKRRIMLGTFASSAGYAGRYYEKAARVRTLIVRDFENAFRNVDVLIAPVSPTVPFKLGEKVDDPLAMYLSDVLTVPVNLAGLPALALPCGFTASRLPIGMQLIGPRWSEEMLFDLGVKYQALTNWHERRPG